jgi:hypothetical protein
LSWSRCPNLSRYLFPVHWRSWRMPALQHRKPGSQLFSSWMFPRCCTGIGTGKLQVRRIHPVPIAGKETRPQNCDVEVMNQLSSRNNGVRDFSQARAHSMRREVWLSRKCRGVMLVLDRDHRILSATADRVPWAVIMGGSWVPSRPEERHGQRTSSPNAAYQFVRSTQYKMSAPSRVGGVFRAWVCRRNIQRCSRGRTGERSHSCGQQCRCGQKPN